jgi:hypothetical protein
MELQKSMSMLTARRYGIRMAMALSLCSKSQLSSQLAISVPKKTELRRGELVQDARSIGKTFYLESTVSTFSVLNVLADYFTSPLTAGKHRQWLRWRVLSWRRLVLF